MPWFLLQHHPQAALGLSPFLLSSLDHFTNGRYILSPRLFQMPLPTALACSSSRPSPQDHSLSIKLPPPNLLEHTMHFPLTCLKQASTRLGGNIFLQKNIRRREVVRPWEGVQGDNSKKNSNNTNHNSGSQQVNAYSRPGTELSAYLKLKLSKVSKAKCLSKHNNNSFFF